MNPKAVGVTLLLAIGVSACGGATAAESTPSASPTAGAARAQPSTPASAAAQTTGLRKAIFATPSADFTGFPSAVAKDRGFFAQHGLDMTVQLMTTPVAMAALTAGEIQFTSGTGTAARSAVQGLPVRVIAHIQTEPFSFLTRPEVAAIGGLKGQKVGFNSIGGDDYVFTLTALKKGGLNPEDVQLITVGSTAEITKALMAGQISGGLVGPPFAQQLAAQGFHIQAGPDLMVLPSGGLATSVQELQKDPALVRDTLEAILDVIVWTRSNPDQAVAYFSSKYDLPPEITKPAYDQMMSSLRFSFSDQDLQGVIQRALEQAKSSKSVGISDVYDLTTFNELVKAKGLA